MHRLEHRVRRYYGAQAKRRIGCFNCRNDVSASHNRDGSVRLRYDVVLEQLRFRWCPIKANGTKRSRVWAVEAANRRAVTSRADSMDYNRDIGFIEYNTVLVVSGFQGAICVEEKEAVMGLRIGQRPLVAIVLQREQILLYVSANYAV